jgi:hypothetical protein
MAMESPGARQFLAERVCLLDEYDRARMHSRAHEVETYHGNVAEASVRSWLDRFLPKRYGVTPGYVIAQRLGEPAKLPHYDVIIYDQLEAPVLWVEDNPDTASKAQSRAIPVEHVQAVIEVKARLTRSSAQHATEHLCDLMPFMEAVDSPDERYKKYLPHKFFCASLFFELRKDDERDHGILDRLIPGHDLRGYFGVLILRGEGLPDNVSCGRFQLLQGATSEELRLVKGPSLFVGATIAEPVKRTRPEGNYYLSGMLTWPGPNFAAFAFDVVALLNGTYRSGFLSSFHGMIVGGLP